MDPGPLSLPDWDAALLPLPGLSDFRLTLAGDRAVLEAETQAGYPPLHADQLEEAAQSLLPPGLALDLRLLRRDNVLTLHPGCKRVVGREEGAP